MVQCIAVMHGGSLCCSVLQSVAVISYGLNITRCLGVGSWRGRLGRCGER